MRLGFVPWDETLSELRTVQCWTDILAEFYSNFIIMFIATGVGVHTRYLPDQYSILAGALTGGWYVFVGIETWAHVNGASINPCVVALFVLTKRVSVIKGLLYIPTQLAGGTAGVWFLKQCIPTAEHAYIVPLNVHPDITPLQGVGIEWVITTGLMTCILGVLDDQLRELNMPAFPAGTAITLGILMGGRYTGAAMNPTIAFAPAAINNVWTNHWVYWTGPMLGVATSLIGYGFFSWQIDAKKAKEREQFSISALPQLTLGAATGLVQPPVKSPNGVPAQNGILPVMDMEVRKKKDSVSSMGVNPPSTPQQQYKGFFIRQHRDSESEQTGEDDSRVRKISKSKGFYTKPQNLHHRF